MAEAFQPLHEVSLQKINDAAYWDYQRNKVFVRSTRQRLQSRKIANRQFLADIPVNKSITLDEQTPVSCRRCNSVLIYKYGRLTQTIYDLKSSVAGVKRWVTRYSFSRFICWNCKATLQLYKHQHKYGIGLRAYLLYQMIELLVPQNALARSIRELFKLPLSAGSINQLKKTEANRLEPVYRGRCVDSKMLRSEHGSTTVLLQLLRHS